MKVYSSCSHKYHLFESPLCKKLPLIRRIVNIVFHILTLGISLLFYHVVSFCLDCCCKKALNFFLPKRVSDADDMTLLLGRGFDSVITQGRIDHLLKGDGLHSNVPPIPSEGLEALRFAKEELRKYYAHGDPNILNDYIKSPDTKQPINKEIIILEGLYNKVEDHIHGRFRNLLQQYNPGWYAWKDPIVFARADDAFKITYALSILALDDLDRYCQEHNLEDRETVCAENSDSYILETLYKLTWLYHNLRSRMIWHGGRMQYKKEIPKDYADLFFDECNKDIGSCCRAWRIMYNDYGHRIRCYFNEEKLLYTNPQFLLWISPDTNRDYFIKNPSK